MRGHERPAHAGWRFRLHEIVYEADTRGGKLFDVLLLTAIVASVAAVMLESVPSVRARHGAALLRVEWGFTILFTVEYVGRLASVRYPSRYAASFFGVVDLLAVVPTYLSLVLPGSQALLVVRVLRMIRIFRVLKLGHYLRSSSFSPRSRRVAPRPAQRNDCCWPAAPDVDAEFCKYCGASLIRGGEAPRSADCCVGFERRGGRNVVRPAGFSGCERAGRGRAPRPRRRVRCRPARRTGRRRSTPGSRPWWPRPGRLGIASRWPSPRRAGR